MPFKKRDFILVDYVGRISETGEVFDTTIGEVAKKEGIYKDGGLYEPSLVAVGEGFILKALEDGLTNLKLRKTEKIDIPPEKAFGNRDPDKARLYPLRKLTSKGITPQIGMRLEVDGRFATVRTMGSGRVLLDFNPPLAGKTLIYEVTVQKKLRTAKDKIAALIHRRIPQVEVEKFSLDIGKNQVTINIPEEAFYVEGLQISKRGLFGDIQKFFPKIRTVMFTETYRKADSAEEAPSSEETRQDTGGSQ